MSKMDELADELALMALDLEEDTGDDNTIKKIADALGSSSPTFEETFLTAVRVRRADRRARRLIDSLRTGGPEPAVLPKPGGDESGH